MSNPQDPNQWAQQAQQGWQPPAQGQDQTQIAPQFGGQQYGVPQGQPNADQTQIAPQFSGQWAGDQAQQPQATQQYSNEYQAQGFGGYQAPQQQFGQQPLAGQQFGDQFAPAAPKKSRNGMIIGIAAAVIVVIVVVAGVVLWQMGVIFGKKFDNAKVNAGVAQVLKDNYGESDVKDVNCKTDGVKVKEGQTFNCTATVGGTQKTIKIKVLDSDGKFQVGAPS